MARPNCPYSWMPVDISKADDPGLSDSGRARFLRINCPYCGKNVGINWDSCLRKHKPLTEVVPISDRHMTV